jgi:nicotinamidase-related amidase
VGDAQNHGTAAVIRADFKCSPSVHRYAKSVRTGRNLGDALDGTGAAGHCRNSGAQSSANGFHPLHNTSKSRRQAGRWQRYFSKWECATRSCLSSSQLEIVLPLSRLIPPATVIDKPAYSAFAESGLTAFLRDKSVDTLIVTGSETDVCVLATVLDAVDLGFRVIVVEDALCSSFDEGHDALMTLYRNRFSEQIELMTHELVSDLWRDPL